MTDEKNPSRVAAGRKGGRIGGLAKGKKGLAAMSPEKREAIRQKALATRRANKAAKIDGMEYEEVG